MRSPVIPLCAGLFAAALAAGAAAATPVTVENFNRAETDLYFGRLSATGGFGQFSHRRTMSDVDHQDVVRMNRDTLYSSGVFDLAAGPLTVTLPDPGRRFMSMQVVNEDHYTTEVVYAPGTHTYTAEQIGTRYVVLIVRTLANPEDPADLAAVHALQDKIQTSQAARGKWEAPAWDEVSQKKLRDTLAVLGSMQDSTPKARFGARNEVNPIDHLIGTATGWGGNPNYAAVYASCFPAKNDGQTAYTLTVKDVPVDGFWSLSVYNAEGYFVKNPLDAYSVNNLTAKPNADGSVTLQFGGDPHGALNYLPIMPGWNYAVRLYRPRQEIIEGKWKFPSPELER